MGIGGLADFRLPLANCCVKALRNKKLCESQKPEPGNFNVKQRGFFGNLEGWDTNYTNYTN